MSKFIAVIELKGSSNLVAQELFSFDARINILDSSNESKSMNNEEVIVKNENNPQYYKLIINELLYYIITTQGMLAPRQMEKTLNKIHKEKLFSPSTLSIYYFLKMNKAATRQRMADELETPEATIYKNIKPLLKHGFIKRVGLIKAPSRGGRRMAMYAVPDVKPEEIAEAKQQEESRNMPGFQLVGKISQFMIDEWVPTSSTPKEVIGITAVKAINRNFDLSTYSKKAIYDMVFHNMQKAGIKVYL